jgi:hypothetical protein
MYVKLTISLNSYHAVKEVATKVIVFFTGL